MGKKDKKKKGRGIEKTAAKTEKKMKNKLKKELAALGEEDIEVMIARSQEESKMRLRVTEETTSSPSPRSNFTLTCHPEKDELFLFGGEFYNGAKTTMYNELYIYCLKKREWRLLSAPNPPTPRSSHQCVSVAQAGGQLWIFGGEYASPSEEQFYHYRDLWVYHIKNRKWECVNARGGPSARSGHRMVSIRGGLLVFGGFHDINTSFVYFNDVHIFSFDSFAWQKLEPLGAPPSPRSGCVLASLVDGRVLMYGGYHKERTKKEDKGMPHSDLHYLTPSKHDDKWKWVSEKVTGACPSLRSGVAHTVSLNNVVWIFGGVFDQEEMDSDFSSVFHDDLYKLDLTKGAFYQITLSEKKTQKKRRRRKDKAEGDGNDLETELEAMDIEDEDSSTPPCGRRNAGLVLKHGKLYLYGGVVEEKEKIFTMDDLYCLDATKLNTWECLQASTEKSKEWQEMEESSDSEDDEDAEDDDEDEDDDDDMEDDD